MATIGILPLGRTTFDVGFAEEKLARMLAALDASGHRIAGTRGLLFDADATRAALDGLAEAEIDRLLLLQVTFTDASMTVAAADRFDVPLAIWAVPEPRTGGRLRLNAFCGLNLASHALGRNNRAFGWLYADPAGMDGGGLDDLLSGRRDVKPLEPHAPSEHSTAEGEAAAAALSGSRIARIGTHPEGFDTCAYDDDAVAALGASVEPIELATLFSAARHVPAKQAQALRREAGAVLTGLDTVDQQQLDRSLRLKLALDELRGAGGFDAFAIRCWPETFTEYGGAVCGPVSMLGEARVPCACEADVYGALTQILLQKVADAPVFLADLVDIDTGDDTGVVWHCGQAPLSMADPDARAAATIHTNRNVPLLYEFSLKPGRVTLMRLSQAHGTPRMVLAGGEMLGRDMAFTGTSGVLRFDRRAGDILNDIMNSGLEHHMAIAYGEHRPVLRSAAAALGLPLIEL
ncbi:MAG: L-fucose/L-arabinose isomerase family protein [Paracoccaceae bacterium]